MSNARENIPPTIEDKMSKFHDELSSTLQSQFSKDKDRWRENELRNMRVEEQTKYRNELAALRVSLKAEHDARLDKILMIEERKLEDAKSTKRQVEEAAFAARQELERELDKARRAAVDKEREFAIRKDTLELEAGRLKSRALALKGREDGLEREESQVKFK